MGVYGRVHRVWRVQCTVWIRLAVWLLQTAHSPLCGRVSSGVTETVLQETGRTNWTGRYGQEQATAWGVDSRGGVRVAREGRRGTKSGRVPVARGGTKGGGCWQTGGGRVPVARGGGGGRVPVETRRDEHCSPFHCSLSLPLLSLQCSPFSALPPTALLLSLSLLSLPRHHRPCTAELTYARYPCSTSH